MLSKHHAFLSLLHMTWWQLGLSSKEDICVSLCQLLVEAGRAGLSQTPSTARTVTSSTCRKQVCSLEEVHCGSARSTAVDGGNSDTRSIQVVSFHLRVTYRSCQWLLESFDLGSLCWLTFGRKSTVWWEISSHLDLMPKTQSLKEDAGKYQCNCIIKANSTLKQVK